MGMTSRERVLCALKHQEPDRVPIDLGGTDITTIMVGPYIDLAKRLEVQVDPIYLMDPKGQNVLVNDEMKDRLGIDTTLVHPKPKSWYRGEAYNGAPVFIPDRFRPELQPDGSRILPGTKIQMVEGATLYTRMPGDHPLQKISNVSDLDQYLDLIEAFEWPDWFDQPWDLWEQDTKSLAEASDRMVTARFSAHIFQAGQVLRGWSEFLLDLASNPSLAERLMDMLTTAHIKAFDRFNRTAGKYVDVIVLTDDLGMQNGPWIRTEMYRKLVKPYHKKLIQHIKKKSKMYVLFHSDGAISPLLPDLIEAGVDIINPVQYTAKGMELEKLKKEFGKELVFWGAGIDTQHTLPFGKPEEIVDEVKRNIDILAPGGGFVFATIHNILEGMPGENIEASFQTALTHGKY